jgi:hypothetical protein
MGDCSEPKYAQLSGMDLSKTLGRQLIGVADNLRNLLTLFGMRPYEVHIVRTRWSGGERGIGQEFVISDTPILPTPLISSLDGITRIVNSVGIDEQGTVKLSEVSGRYSENFLSGQDYEGNPQDGDTQWFYEVQFPTPGTVADGAPRRRFFPSSSPTYNPSKFEWTLTLTRSHVDRLNDGTPAGAGDLP